MMQRWKPLMETTRPGNEPNLVVIPQRHTSLACKDPPLLYPNTRLANFELCL